MSTTTNPHTVENLPIGTVAPDPDNVDRPIDEAFAQSIAQHGVLQPILVRPADDDATGYVVIAGHRRYHAAVAAGFKTIPAMIRSDATDSDAGVWQAVENLARADLTPSQEALQVVRIMSEGVKQRALAASLNRPLSWVRTRIALASCPDNVRDAIDAGRYEVSEALDFARYLDRPEVIDAVIDDQFSRRDVAGRLDWANRRYDEAQAIVAAVEELTGNGITAYRGELPGNVTARRVSELAGIDPDAHSAEPCHVAVVRAHSWQDHIETVAYCTAPGRHAAKGDSELTVTRPTTARTPERQAELDRQKVERDAKAHRDGFARDAILGRIRSKDLAEVVLPVLLARAGQTELKEAAQLLAVTEPAPARHPGGPKDWTGPFTDWANQSSAQLHRAMLAIAYVQGVNGWHDNARQAVTGWLDRLDYQPATD